MQTGGGLFYRRWSGKTRAWFYLGVSWLITLAVWGMAISSRFMSCRTMSVLAGVVVALTALSGYYAIRQKRGKTMYWVLTFGVPLFFLWVSIWVGALLSFYS